MMYLLPLLVAAAPRVDAPPPEKAKVVHTETEDRKAILHHIDTIFDAFIRKDRATLRSTHTKDWTGFQGPSVKIERGIDDYMVNAEKSLEHLDGTGYELLDTEIQLYGDLAVVYYVARYDFRDKEGHAGSIPLRSIDIYRRIDGHWIQIGSHIGAIPATRSWTADDRNAKSTGQTAKPENK